MSGQKSRPTEDKYQDKKPQILKMFQAGFPMRRIQANITITQYYLKKIREELIDEGLITREEIKEAFDRYMAENPNAQGLDKHRVRQKSNTEKADAKHSRYLAKKERVFELVKQKKSIVEIANEIQITKTTVRLYINQLIEEGRLTEDEIVKVPIGTTAVYIDKTTSEFITKRDEVVSYLGLGWKYAAIRRKLEITTFYMDIYLRDIKAKGIMTQKEIEVARERKRTQDLNDLEAHINAGGTIDKFREMKPEFTYNEVTPLIKELIETGKITREQIEANRMTAAKQSLNKNVKMSPEEQLEFIIKKVKKGYSPQEIVDSDKTKSLTKHKVLYQKRQIIAKGIISQEEADQAMERRQNRKLDRKHSKIISQIKEYTKLGYSLKEISEKIGYEYTYTCTLKSAYEKENGWFTKEELKEFKRQRKIREFEALPQEEKDRIEEEKRQEELRKETKKQQRKAEALAKRQERKEQTLKKRQKDIETIKAYVKELKTASEIAEITSWTTVYIYQLIKESKAAGTWLTAEELQQIKEKREEAKKKKEEEAKKKKQSNSLAKRQERKEQTLKKRQKDIETIKTNIKALKTVQEIASTNSWTTAYVYQLIKESKEAGTWLTEEELQQIKEKRGQEKKNRQSERKEEKQAQALAKKQERQKQTLEKRQKDIETIKAYVKELKTAPEIAEITSWTTVYIYQLIKESKAAGTWLTAEELQQIKEKKEEVKKKKQEEAKKKKRAESLTKKQERKQSEQQRKMQEVYQVRELAMDGFITLSEISEKMHYSTFYIKNLIDIAKEQKLWFSDRTLNKFKEMRKKREEREAKKKLKQEQDALHAIDVEKRHRIRAFEDEYKRLRKKAKHEDTLEMDGEKNVSTEGRKKFVTLLMKLFAEGITISKKDITIIMNAIYMNPDFVNKDILKLLIANANAIGGLDEAEKMIKELAFALENTRYSNPLYQYRKWINQQRCVHQIIQLKDKGLKPEGIAQKLGITSAEVVVFLKNANQDVDFFDDDVDK